MAHPFDRYSGFTDLSSLKEASIRPLRKCIRINTLKTSIEDFKAFAEKNHWDLEEVEWCKEGLFIDRENRENPLGKNLRHLLGSFYMQEASSMLPVSLLDPEPGETILDMAAAPGSKSTQIAAAMQGQGVIIANDMQEKRLHTLKDALSRLGVLNVIITKKMGQWYGKHMTGRFDRVLIDAPCTAQGISRKDPNALEFCSEHSIGKAAKLQRELLEAAVHSTRINGRIVYSTCTLTPEENEEVIASVLNKYCDQLSPLHPKDIEALKGWDFSQALADSETVQKHLGFKEIIPCLRLWPQTYNTEGFFCAVLTKTGPTQDLIPVVFPHRQEEPLSKSRQNEISNYLAKRYGSSMINDGETIVALEDHFSITTKEAAKLKLATRDYSMGLPFGKKVRDAPVYIDHEFATLRGTEAKENICELTDEQLKLLLQGKDFPCDEELFGHILLHYDGICIGRGRAREGKMKNHLPRWMVQMLA